MKTPYQVQQGFAAISAIFLLVVLAALGAFMLSVSNTAQLTSAQDVLGTRAYWAARAGLEWGVGSISAQPSATANCLSASTSLPVGTIDGFNIDVTCERRTYTEAGTGVHIFQFTSIAKSSSAVGSMAYIERSLTASMEY